MPERIGATIVSMSKSLLNQAGPYVSWANNMDIMFIAMFLALRIPTYRRPTWGGILDCPGRDDEPVQHCCPQGHHDR